MLNFLWGDGGASEVDFLSMCGLDFYMICIDFDFSMLVDKAASVCL